MAVRKLQTDDWAEQLRSKVELINRVGSTPDGKALLELLQDVFEDRTLRHSDPYQTYYNLGQRDVAQYLRQLAEMSDA